MIEDVDRSGIYELSCLSKDIPTEVDRLRLLEQVLDPATTEVLSRLPVERDWRCLELGAGAGSVAYWLADRCPDGTVLAVDQDTRLLDPARSPNLQVVTLDLTTADLPAASFDLVHARMVLCHLEQRADVLESALRWVAPDGWLVLEEPYWMASESSPHRAVRRLFTGAEAALARHGADMRWAARLPGYTAALTGRQPLVEATPTYFGGPPGSPNRAASFLNVFQIGPLLVNEGVLAESEVSDVIELLHQPSFLDLMSVNLSVCVQAPHREG